ncbi:carbohydrate kinase family protein [Methanohalophilus halophilus]|uniref:Adenosine kinase n=1 Tax=Methanohalophilus halophilus TaxID=2177 RepID=A0A1L3PZW3_9EURY|nr:carbohydrate kinase family protein [Methanohalophilus halophilus]APH38158.1 carbohydrate kinase family protein [Methanohalophilus halophilus]RNI10974.1 carbohydrate kinase family protein [Methanohalophilus halophilus]SDW80559.1 adenosine kinase [Methanohalophilus halophilus]
MDKALICGSFAFDNIMVFNDKFKNHILPDKVHILNVSFLVPQLRREFGGCAGNIAYNLKLLGGDPLPMGTVGTDFEHYAKWMDEKGINREHVNVVDDTFTAQAFITTDMDDNQITAFHPGAMDYSHNYSVLDVGDHAVGIVAPDGKEGMIQHAREFASAGIPFIFDPGQGLPMFDGDELMKFIDQATWLTVNDYEWQLIQERTGKSQEEISAKLKALIVTKGPEGSLIYKDGEVIQIPAAKPAALQDPTGCGDAYRAGLLYGLTNDLDWETTGRIASLMGAIKIEHQGTQNHHFKLADFKRRFKESFGTVF